MQISIGDGKATKIGTDPWLPTVPPRPPILVPTADPNQPVSCLIDERAHEWNMDKLRQTVDPSDHSLIYKTFLPLHPTRNAIIWCHTTHGNNTVKSGYWLASTLALTEEHPRPVLFHHPDIANNIWKQSISPKL